MTLDIKNINSILFNYVSGYFEDFNSIQYSRVKVPPYDAFMTYSIRQRIFDEEKKHDWDFSVVLNELKKCTDDFIYIHLIMSDSHALMVFTNINEDNILGSAISRIL